MSKFGKRRSRPWLGALALFPCVLWAQSVDTVQSPELASQTPTAGQSTAQASLTLEDIVQKALSKNPEVQSALHAVNALQRHVPQVKSLPDPMVSVGWAGNITPFSLQA
jgi:outer membrane protein TolC